MVLVNTVFRSVYIVFISFIMRLSLCGCGHHLNGRSTNKQTNVGTTPWLIGEQVWTFFPYWSSYARGCQPFSDHVPL